MQLAFSVKKIISKYGAFWIPLIVSLAVWMNPRFFMPQTFINYGDMGFPLNPPLYLRSMLYLWIDSNGLGVPSIYSPFLCPILVVFYLSKLGIPLWILNRLWIVLPLAAVGWGTMYLFRTVFKGKNSFIAGSIAGIFAMLVPISEIYSYQYFSLAGFALVFAVFIQLLDGRKWTLQRGGLAMVGMTLLNFTPRYLYLTVLVCVVYAVLILLSQRQEKERPRLRSVFFAITTIVLASAYLLVPLFAFFFLHKANLASEFYSRLRTPEGYQTGLSLWNDYKTWVHPVWVLRLLTSNPYAPLTPFMQSLMINLLSCVMPLYAFACFFMNKNKKLVMLGILALWFIFLSASPTYAFSSQIYLLLFHKLPGFFIFKSPAFFLIFLGIFYALFTGATTQILLNRIDHLSGAGNRPAAVRRKTKIALIAVLLALIGNVYGGALLIGKSPRQSLAGWGNVIYANHTPSARIPQEYFMLRDYLAKNNDEQGIRMINLPWTRGGYLPYTWWNHYDTVEVMALLSPVPILGASFPPTRGWLVDFAKSVETDDIAQTLYLTDMLRIGLILIHKDYDLPALAPQVQTYIETLKKHEQYFSIIMDNEYFILFETKIQKPAVFSF